MNDPEFQHIRRQACPHCGYASDSLGTLGPTTPRPRRGDMSVCIGCGELLRFDRKLRLVRMPATAIAALPEDDAQELAKVQLAVRMLIANG